MARVLVVGADGLIGADLVRFFSSQGLDVLGTSRRQAAAPSTLRLDLAEADPETWPLPEVDCAIFTAAMARFSDCRADPDLARRVNVEMPARLAGRLAWRGTRSILLSTSAVFDGTSPHRPADAPTAAASIYGALKSEAERAFLDLGDRGAVVRLTKVLVPDHPLIAGWIAALRRGEAVEAFDDLHLAPIGLADVRAGVAAAMRSGGVFQVSGARDVTYLDILRHLARRLGAAPDLACPASAAARGIPEAERPAFTSLDTRALSAATSWRAPEAFALVDALYVDNAPAS